jgi:hypothetical protein
MLPVRPLMAWRPPTWATARRRARLPRLPHRRARHAGRAAKARWRRADARRRAARRPGRPGRPPLRRPGRPAARPRDGAAGLGARQRVRRQRRQALQVRAARQAPHPQDPAQREADACRTGSTARSRWCSRRRWWRSAPRRRARCWAGRWRCWPSAARGCMNERATAIRRVLVTLHPSARCCCRHGCARRASRGPWRPVVDFGDRAGNSEAAATWLGVRHGAQTARRSRVRERQRQPCRNAHAPSAWRAARAATAGGSRGCGSPPATPRLSLRSGAMSGMVGSSSTPSVPSSCGQVRAEAVRNARAATCASVTSRDHAKRSATPGPSGGA